MALQEVVQAFPEGDCARFRKWFSELNQEKWDQRIDEDDEEGKLDSLIAEAFESKEKITLWKLWMHRTTPRFCRQFERGILTRR